MPDGRTEDEIGTREGGAEWEGENKNGTTTSVKERWVYTNDILAGLLITSLPVLLVLQAINRLPPLQTQVFAVYATSVSLATVWAFGKGAVMALRKLRK